MTRDDIIKMAREAGLTGLMEGGLIDYFERFAALVAAAEREACATLVETLLAENPDLSEVYVAAEIRARGEQ
jgi:hypothetical protein